MKKVLSFILVLSMVLGSFGMTFAAPASDVKGTEYENAVETLSVLGIMKGYEDGTFKPGNDITRAEFAAIVVRALGQESVAQIAANSSQFSDVPAGQWFTGYVNVAASLKVVNGMGDGTFAPNSPVTYEQAVTMVMRALGYEPAAQEKGGYPVGYMLVANDVKVTKDVEGVLGQPAPRGIVAQLVDNALTVPMMVAVEFGSGVKYVKAGENDTPYKDLLGEFLDAELWETTKDVTVAVTDIPRTGTKDGQIKINGKTFKLAEFAADADVEALFGLQVRAWINDNDEILRIELDEEVLYDFVSVTKTGAEIKLTQADTKYDVDSKAVVYINGEKESVNDLVKDDKYDFGKVSLNADGEVDFIELIDWTGFMVVEEVKEYDVLGYGDEVDVEDFTIIKDGKTITVEDLEKGDILYYNGNVNDGYAEVYNKNVEGEITKIYADRAAIAGKEYRYVNPNNNLGAVKYIDENGDVATLANNSTVTEDVLETMKDAGKVAVYLDRDGDMVYITGDLSELETTGTYVYVTKTAKAFLDRGTEKWAVDGINSAGEKVAYDLKESDMSDIFPTHTTTWAAGVNSADITAGKVFDVTLDKDGDVTELVALTSAPVPAGAETDDKYFNGMKLSSNTVVFLTENYTTNVKDIVVKTWSELDFEDILAGTYYLDGDKVVAIDVTQSDRGGDATAYSAVVTAAPIKVAGENTWRIKLAIDGVAKNYFTEEDTWTAATLPTLVAGDFAVVTINDDTEEIEGIADINIANRVVTAGAASNIVTSTKSITIGGVPVKLGDSALVLDGTDSYKVIGLSNIKAGEMVKAFRVSNGSNYVQLLVKTGGVTAPTTITLASDINANVTVTGHVYNAGKQYFVQAINANGSVVATTTPQADSATTITFPTVIAGPGIFRFRLFEVSKPTEVITEIERYIQ